ncbi:MAG TPA: SEFIR domain-containing protein [Bacillus sp. (in: firmicutes)]|nr:SEFIR domain-containing protein [Bacillus sp. (in: firmicutes)]
MDRIKVFISYSHDSEEHKQKVLDLATKLIEWGIDCELDQFLEGTPTEGWPRWMVNQLENVDFVLIVNSEIYKERFEGRAPEGKGQGGKWEGAIITQQLYEAEMNNTRFIPVVFNFEDTKHIPLVLRAASYYNISVDSQFENLYRYLTNQPKILKPHLGERRILETGINLKKNND